jgi:hypothetical protein
MCPFSTLLIGLALFILKNLVEIDSTSYPSIYAFPGSTAIATLSLLPYVIPAIGVVGATGNTPPFVPVFKCSLDVRLNFF